MKNQLAIKKAGDTLEASYKTIDIARMYRFMKEYKKQNNIISNYFQKELILSFMVWFIRKLA